MIFYRHFSMFTYARFCFKCFVYTYTHYFNSSGNPYDSSVFILIFQIGLFKHCIMYFWLPWVFTAACGLSLVGASGDCSPRHCVGFSLWGLLLLQSTGSVVVAHAPSCSTAYGILLDQGVNPCPLHWQTIPIHYTTREDLRNVF